MKGIAAWKQKDSEPWGHCSACNPKKCLLASNDKKHAAQAMKRKKTGSRIMLREIQLGQDRV